MLYMVIETFRDGAPRPVYGRFAERGRLAPAGLGYVASWVTDDLRRCFQVMECEDPALLEEWMAQWRDIVDFEVVPVVASADAAAAVAAVHCRRRVNEDVIEHTSSCPKPGDEG